MIDSRLVDWAWVTSMEIVYVLLVCLLPAVPACALAGQELNDTTMREVSVSATMPGRNTSSSMPVQQMKRGEMMELGMTDLADAIRRMAGANVKDYGGLGGMKTVSVRNMGAAHTAVALDGIPVSNSQAGQIDIGRFDIRHLESVSLAVGHQEDLLQSARLLASAAVLSLESRKPTFLKDRRWGLDAMCTAGQWGEVSPSLEYRQRIGDGTTLSVGGGFARSDGTYPYTLQMPNSKPMRLKRSNNGIWQYRTEAELRQAFRNGGTLTVRAYNYTSDRELPGHVIFHNVKDSHESLRDDIRFVQALYRQDLSHRWSIMAQGKYNHGRSKYRDEGVQYAAGYTQERYTQQEGSVCAAVSYRPHGGWELALSQDGVLSTLRSEMKYCPNPDRLSSYTALSARYGNARFRATASLVGTVINEHVQRDKAADDIRHLSPSVALRYTPWTGIPLHLRAMYKNTFRPPSFNDLYYRSSGSLDLEPEDAQELSAGITFFAGQAGPLRRAAITADGYWNRVENKIVAIPTTYVWKMRNYGLANMSGMDVTASATLTLPASMYLDIQGAYSWMRAIDLTDPGSKSYRNQLPYTPRHSGNAGLLLHTPWLNVGYTIVAAGKRYILAQNIPSNEVEAYHDHTLTLSRELKMGGCSLSVMASATNLFDANYDVIRYYPMPGRAFHITLEFTL